MGLYVGFDCSTQSLSVVVIDATRQEVAYSSSVVFQEPFLSADDPTIVHASPRMWAEALFEGLARVAANVDCRAIRAISGSAQQHGSVYCGSSPEILTRRSSPIWMDSSTCRECEEIERAIGGPRALARLTGSRAYPRFTGPQIRKFAREAPEAYRGTERIHLVSSYMASLLSGAHMPVDHADASGMNLMDITARRWSREALDATAPGLAPRLPPLVPSAAVVGTLCPALQKQTRLGPIPLVAWSGDNPCSLVGTGLIDEGQLSVSLGTSDTIFGPMKSVRLSEDLTGHVFASPLGEYMGITVFRNGSLARERVREELGMTWRQFSDALTRTEPGNGGAMMLPWFEPEITPQVPGAHPQRLHLEGAPPAVYVRAIVEAQAMALYRHSEWMSVAPRTLYATGGAAANREILQVIADVFAADVYRFDSTGSAALGAALRAYQAASRLPWPEVIAGFAQPVAGSRIVPVPEHVATYRRLRPSYDRFETHAIANLPRS